MNELRLTIARDENGDIYLYVGSFQKRERTYCSVFGGNSVPLRKGSFPEITWDSGCRTIIVAVDESSKALTISEMPGE